MLDTLVQVAKSHKLETIIGYYYPTPKNNMVKEFYKKMGFEFISEDENGNTAWKLDLGTYEPKNPAIETNR